MRTTVYYLIRTIFNHRFPRYSHRFPRYSHRFLRCSPIRHTTIICCTPSLHPMPSMPSSPRFQVPWFPLPAQNHSHAALTRCLVALGWIICCTPALHPMSSSPRLQVPWFPLPAQNRPRAALTHRLVALGWIICCTGPPLPKRLFFCSSLLPPIDALWILATPGVLYVSDTLI
jgi:hypothetical protein